MIELHITAEGIEGAMFDRGGSVISTTKYQSEANLPAELREKLSVLKLVGVNEAVDDVGQKVSDTLYWIFDTAEQTKPKSMWFLVMQERAIRDKSPLRDWVADVNGELLKKLSEGKRHDNTRDVLNRNERSTYWRDIYRSKRGNKY